MEEIHKSGKAKAIGVSNYSVKTLVHAHLSFSIDLQTSVQALDLLSHLFMPPRTPNGSDRIGSDRIRMEIRSHPTFERYIRIRADANPRIVGSSADW